LPLATALVPEGGPAPHADVAFAFDADTAYRLVAEVLYTAGQARAERVHLAVDHGGAIAEITGAVPRPVRPQPMLTVAVVDSGYIVSTPGGRVSAECGAADAGATAAPAGAGATVPKRFGGFDTTALTACVSRLARQDATVAGKHELTVTAEPGAPFGDVVRALDAVRVAPDGTPLFTEVHFGIPL
jgi:biopolymer transport protein ExbD